MQISIHELVTLLKCCQTGWSAQGEGFVVLLCCFPCQKNTQSLLVEVEGGAEMLLREEGWKYMEHLLELAWYINCL